MIRMIAALDERGAIGREGMLPFQQRADMRHFMAYTRGATVLMGQKTAVSLPGLLKGRTHLVLTRGGSVPDGMQRVEWAQILDTYHGADDAHERDLVVIGGESVYAAALPYAQRISLTHVHTRVDGADAFFPLAEMMAQSPWFPHAHGQGPADAENACRWSIQEYFRIESDRPPQRRGGA